MITLNRSKMKESTNPFYSTPVAILLGSFVISVAILMHGGIIKIGKSVVAPAAPPSAAQPAAPVAKTEADIVKKLKEYAAKLELDQNKFNSCLDSGSKASLVRTDYDEGSKAGVNGTPAFFINGRLLSGALPFSEFKTVIEQELTNSTPADTQRVTVRTGDLPAQGSPNAKVALIEFSDYQCPFCGRHFSQAEQQIKKDYIDTGKVKFYYRDFPLSQIHPGAQKGAEAARCAGDQNKYWEYHDLIFQNQQDIF